MDPVTLAGVASWLIGGFVSEFGKTAGSRVANVVLGPNAPTSNVATREDLLALEQRLLAQMRASSDIVPVLEAAVREDAENFPTVASWVKRERPGLLERALNISVEQGRFQRSGRCPVGGELLFLPPSYSTPDGRQLSAFQTFGQMRKASAKVLARCRKGHTWEVF